MTRPETPAASSEPLRIGRERIPAGTRRRLELPLARLFTGDWLSLPVVVIHGRRPGPRLLLDAAIHGDELNGMEIIRQVLARLDPEGLAGAVVAVPVVNVFGFIQQDRYLPDRRDLNRSFPGSTRGSTAARLAHLFLEEVVSRCDYGIDFHTGSNHRRNLPQVRGPLEDSEVRRIATAFGAPMMYAATEIGGSLRSVARRRGVRLVVYEAGEPLRFDDEAIRVGITGTFRVLRELGMWDREPLEPAAPSFEAGQTRWVRAGRSGIFHISVRPGQTVRRNEELGFLTDPFSDGRAAVKSPFGGLVIGTSANPLVHQGDALVHLAKKVARNANATTVPDAGGGTADD